VSSSPSLFERGPVYARYRPLRSGDRRRLRLTLERCPVPAGGLVVEVGCGTGRLLREFRDYRTLGVDPALPMLQQARGVRVVRGVAEALPVRNASTDLAFASLAFHHFADQALAAAELRRVLRPGGHAAIWTATPEHVQTFPLNAWFPSFRAIDTARFPPPERWMSLLARAGFPQVAAQQFRIRRRPTLAWLANAVRERYLSTFDHIGEAEYRAGLHGLEQEAAAAPERRVDYSMEWSLIWARRY
jgi:SAM-dependent methyltransferase